MCSTQVLCPSHTPTAPATTLQLWGARLPVLGAICSKSHSSRRRVILPFEFVELFCPPIPSSSKTGCNSRDYHPTQNCHAHPEPLCPARHVLCPNTGQTSLHHTQCSAEMPKSPGSLSSQIPNPSYANPKSEIHICMIFEHDKQVTYSVNWSSQWT